MRRKPAKVDFFGNPFKVGDWIAMSYSNAKGSYIREAKEIVHVSADGVPAFFDACGRMRQALDPVFRVKRDP